MALLAEKLITSNGSTTQSKSLHSHQHIKRQHLPLQQQTDRISIRDMNNNINNSSRYQTFKVSAISSKTNTNRSNITKRTTNFYPTNTIMIFSRILVVYLAMVLTILPLTVMANRKFYLLFSSSLLDCILFSK